jgi:hypothetical protein
LIVFVKLAKSTSAYEKLRFDSMLFSIAFCSDGRVKDTSETLYVPDPLAFVELAFAEEGYTAIPFEYSLPFTYD